MDKLPEPSFSKDPNYSRKFVGLDDYIAQRNKNYLAWLGIFSFGSIYRYWREVTFYKKDHVFFFCVIVPGFLFTSYQLAYLTAFEPYGEAAVINNEKEDEFLAEYGKYYREARRNNVEIPSNYLA